MSEELLTQLVKMVGKNNELLQDLMKGQEELRQQHQVFQQKQDQFEKKQDQFEKRQDQLEKKLDEFQQETREHFDRIEDLLEHLTQKWVDADREIYRLKSKVAKL